MPSIYRILVTLFWCLSVLAIFSVAASAQPQFDLLILNGRVLDGTGNPWYYADIGIRDSRIVAVGDLGNNQNARRIIDAAGKTITPGFIDLHSHAYDRLRPGSPAPEDESKRRAAPNLVAQGVTTLVTNQDGRGGWPIQEQRSKLTEGGVGPNVILLVGHGVVRRLAMGSEFQREATDVEIKAMQQYLRQGLEAGAWGMSAGLEYVPGRWSNTAEFEALAQVVADSGGVIVEHERGSGEDPMWYLPSQDPPGQPGILQSVDESIRVAEATGVTLICTHIKAKGARFWGAGRAVVNMIEEARARGINIWADSYPYNTTGSDGSTTLIPGWASEREDAKARLRQVLEDATLAADLRRDISHEINRRGGAQNLVVMESPDRALVGKTLAEIARHRETSDVEAAINLALEGFNRRGGVRLRGFSLSEIDVELFASLAWVATASDAGIALPGDGFVHARYYGTFPRKIHHYARTRGVLSIESAIRSMTSLPAQLLGLKDRGLVREGMWADLVVMDLEQVRDTATFFEPHQYPAGIEHVLVGGKFVVENGEHTWDLPGHLLIPTNN